MSQRHIDLVVPITPEDHVLGPEHAPCTVVEYGDFECPLCKQAAPAVRLLLQRFDQRLRVVFRHFPVEATHPHALLAAQAAEAAGAQGKFWQMHDLLFENQLHLEPLQLPGYAAQISLDVPRFIAELDDEIYLPCIREQIEGARASHVRGTPGFFVNGVIQDVSYGMESLEKAVGAALR
jgi:protein-disulfide isomerase